MSGEGPSEAVLRSVLWKLSAFLPDIVVVGGWVPYLHRLYGSGTGWRSEPVFTEELDLLLDAPRRRRDGRTIAEALREAGFRPVGGEAAPSPPAREVVACRLLPSPPRSGMAPRLSWAGNPRWSAESR